MKNKAISKTPRCKFSRALSPQSCQFQQCEEIMYNQALSVCFNNLYVLLSEITTCTILELEAQKLQIHNKPKTGKESYYKCFHLWSSSELSWRSDLKAIQEGNRQLLQMNGATRSHLAETLRTAYLKADVTQCRQPENTAQLNVTQP